MAFHATTRCHPLASTTPFLDGEETQVTDPQAFFTALCHLSVAEDAMRKATGESFPPQPSWGCKDIPRFSANQFNHRWMDCPNKNDCEVQANAAKSYKEWAQAKRDRQAKRPRLFMAAEKSLADRAFKLETTWEQEVHPSLAQAQCPLACAEKSTLPSVRVLAYAKLKGCAEPASKPANNSPPRGGGSTRGGIGFGGGASFLIMAHVAVCALEAIARGFRHSVHVKVRLPHINLPVGDEKDAEILMEAMIDTGAGLNLGRRQYHAEVYRLRPEIVEQ
jgi:hypothetical protein